MQNGQKTALFCYVEIRCAHFAPGSLFEFDWGSDYYIVNVGQGMLPRPVIF